MKLRIFREARQDMLGIGEYIAQDNPERAMAFIGELEVKIRAAAERPRSFPQRDDLYPGLRAALLRPYLILFRIEAEAVEIVPVMHGARDLSVLFGE